MAARGQHKHTKAVWLGAVLTHLALFAIWQGGHASTWSQMESALPEMENEVLTTSSVALIELPSEASQELGVVISAIGGASDQVGASPEAAFQNAVDAPGETTGRRAAGEGGDPSFADRKDKSVRSAGTWNSEGPTLMPHSGEVKRGDTSPESLERNPTLSFSDEAQRRARAHAGDVDSSTGLAGSRGQGGAPGEQGKEWLAADPRFDTAPAAKKKLVSAAVLPQRESARQEEGKTSTEQAKRGPAAEITRSPLRSNRESASAFHLGAPTAGVGTATGARGKAGSSNANAGGRGTASQSGTGNSTALASTRASRSHPYFNEMYRRIDRQLRFPKKLALALEQGDLVLSFQLDKRGRIRSLKINKSSGFAAFDSEAIRAFRAAAPFGVVPQALLGSRDRLAVLAPYYFRNPLIR